MAELVLGALVPVLIEKLASMSSQYLIDFFRSVGVHKLLKEWGATLQSIHDVLEDAEEKQLTNREVRRWLDDLHDFVYDVDDFVDELATEAQARRIKSSYGSRPSTSRFPNCIPAASSINICGINPFEFKFNYKMKPKIEDISGRLKDIFERKKDLGLNNNVIGERVVPSSRQTTSLPPTCVIGREKEKNEIVDMLMKPEADSTQVPVITIQGMGGLGKTTLAQDIYHDEKVVKCFDLKAWVCVSDVFDVADITRTILASRYSSDKLKNFDLNKLQEELKQMLSGKKFLLVLDDIWNENYGEWELLLRPFCYGATGSRILATTRNKRVASTMSRTNEPYVLSALGDDDSLSLLALHALGKKDFHDHRDLKESGEKIVKKCGHLPLAIKTIAGLLLHIPQERKEWEDVLNNKKWAEESDDILPALRLSYYHLPYHLKQCFAYCSIIPKDYIFDKTELVLLWMADGLLQQPTGGSNKQTEDFGHDYFHELLSRSFFQLINDSTTQFIMHDLINDLAVHVVGERCFRIDKDWDNSRKNNKIPERTRHLSFICETYEVSDKFKIFNTAHRSRTFLPLPPHQFRMHEDKMLFKIGAMVMPFHIADTVLALSLSRLQFLRVLNLKGYNIVELPDMIGVLKHLRYLNLSYTYIEQLPQYVCRLYNLQTLSLNGCSQLRELPSSICCLTNLRHLYLEDTPKLEVIPSGIGKLTSLQTLSKFIVGRDNGSCKLKDLKDLRNLHGTLSIEELQNVTDDGDVVAVDLRSREHLENVKLQWHLRDSAGSSRDRILDYRVLRDLQPHCNLKVLEIKGYGGDEFPSWVGGQSMSNVVEIHLEGCSEITHLPPLGELHLLKDLVIKGLGNIRSVGAEFYGGRVEEIAFPSLETLNLCEMRNWNVWSPPVADKELFPRLRELKIDGCPELGSIPTLDLPFLCSLGLWHCKEVWLERLINLTSLKTMSIKDVSGLTCLPEQFVNSLVSLEEAEFHDCHQLRSLWRSNGKSLEGPFNRLNSLYVYWCEKLKKLPNGLHGLASLQEISLGDCPSLVWDMSDRLPKSLKTLELSNERAINHEGFRNIIRTWSDGSLSKSSYFASLHHLDIAGCLGLESFGVTCFPMLSHLVIRDCADLKSLPDGIQGLASLEILSICDCGNLGPIRDKDLPPSLTSLYIRNVGGERKKEKSVVLSDWGFHRLTSLQRLEIVGFEEVVSFEQVVGDSNSTSYLFPPSLTYLSIAEFPNLKSLSKGLHNLTSLRELYINDCPNLESLAGANDEALLQIISSLHSLIIYGKSSKVLRKRCKKEKGKYWPTIQHIPQLVIRKY